jgi:hypothetical protein
LNIFVLELSGALNLMNYLKLLIDPENMMAVSIGEKTEFLSFFYFRPMSVLLAHLWLIQLILN